MTDRTTAPLDGASPATEPDSLSLIAAARRWAGSRIARGAAGTLALKIADAGAAFFINLLLARLLGAAGLGVYAFALAWANLLVVPALSGTETLSVRTVAAYQATNQWGLLHGYLRRALQAVAASSSLLASAAALAAWFLVPAGEARLTAFLVALLIVPVVALMRLGQAVLRGLRHVALGYLPELGVMPLVLIGLLLLAAVVLGDVAPIHAIAAHLAAGIAGLLAGALLVRRHLPRRIRATTASFETRAWIGSALPLLFIGGMQIVNRQTDIIMLGILAGDAAAGIYNIATRGAALVGFVLFAVNAAVAPTIAKTYARGDMTRLQRVATHGARLALLFSLPATLAFVFAGEWFMLLFGPEFAAGATSLAILSIGQFVNASMGSVALLLAMTHHERLAARGFAAGAVVNVGLNALLIPPFGLVGAAVSTGTSLVVWNTVLAVYVYRRLGLHSTALGVVRLRGRAR